METIKEIETVGYGIFEMKFSKSETWYFLRFFLDCFAVDQKYNSEQCDNNLNTFPSVKKICLK